MYKQILLCLPSNYKSLVNIFKGCKFGQAHKYFLLTLLCSSRQTAWLFAPDKLLYRKILWTRKPLKRL